MARSSQLLLSPRRVAVAGALLLRSVALGASSIPMNYCSSVNTASMPANVSLYQSDGLCHGFCSSSYAFAIVQGSSCWCSNVVPATSSQVSIDQCSNACPGYPSDVCGGDGLFGYMQLAIAPSSTAGLDSSPQSTTSPASLPTGMTTLPPTIQTVTAGGTVRTVTVTPTVAIGSAANGMSPSSSSGLGTGAAVGVAVGIVALVAIIVGVGLFLCLRRRRGLGKDGAFDVPSPRDSSSGGAVNTPRTDMSESRFGVRLNGSAALENGEVDALGRRRSKLMPVDPRMNPFGTGIYPREENKSHDSIHTIRDDQDYSRRVHQPPRILRAMNPDPDHGD